MQIVPPPITLKFKLTSNYPIVHNLTTSQVYLCFDRDPKFNVLYPPLRVTVTQFLTSCNLQDVGKAVTNILVSNSTSTSSATLVTPKIISIQVTSVASTGAILNINSISSGYIYFACIPFGSPAITDPAILIAMNSTIGFKGYTTSNAQNISQSKTAQINYAATATITNLSQTSQYVFYAVSNSNLGTSSIVSINFNTSAISKGVQMRLYFKEIVSNLNLVNALVQALRITPLRVKILTSNYVLQQLASNATSSDNKLIYPYDIVIAPDASNDIISPLTLVKNFVTNNSSLSAFSTALPAFDSSKNITYFELRPVFPRVVKMPTISSINLYNATFSMKFLSQSNLYAVLY